MSNHRLNSRSAFTVLEFLAVLAVGVLLIVLLLPKFNQFAEKGRRAACAGNLRQLGVGILAYAADHNMHLPTLQNNAHDCTWDGALLAGNYVQPQALRCPSDKIARPPGIVPRSYAISLGQKGGPPTVYWVHGANLKCQFLTNLAEVVIVSERLWGNARTPEGKEHGNWCDERWLSSAHFRGVDIYDPTTFRKEANYLFLDGHVAWLKEPGAAMFPPIPTNGVPCP